MFPLYKKEVRYYLNNPIGYIILVLFAIFANFMFLKDIFLVGSASMKPFFEIIPWLLLIFIPAITMRSIAEEKKNNTLEMLLTLPISEIQIVLAKFFALITLVAIGLALTLGLPISLYILTSSFVTPIYLPEVLIGYLGVLSLSALFISISMFFSSQTRNQVVAFLLSVLVLFLLLMLGSEFISFLPKVLQNSLAYFSPMTHLQNFTKGLLDLRSIVYFKSFSILFLFLTVIDLEKRA